jgi:hypothetical protein
MSFPHQGFLALTSIHFGGFVVSCGLESGTGEVYTPPELGVAEQAGRRQPLLNAFSREAPIPIIYRTRAKKRTH